MAEQHGSPCGPPAVHGPGVQVVAGPVAQPLAHVVADSPGSQAPGGNALPPVPVAPPVPVPVPLAPPFAAESAPPEVPPVPLMPPEPVAAPAPTPLPEVGDPPEPPLLPPVRLPPLDAGTTPEPEAPPDCSPEPDLPPVPAGPAGTTPLQPRAARAARAARGAMAPRTDPRDWPTARTLMRSSVKDKVLRKEVVEGSRNGSALGIVRTRLSSITFLVPTSPQLEARSESEVRGRRETVPLSEARPPGNALKAAVFIVALNGLNLLLPPCEVEEGP